MKTIQSKIILLSLMMLLFMGSFWIIISYFNQQSIHNYNEILQRYLSLNQTLTASQKAVKELNSYMMDPTVRNYTHFQRSRDALIEAKELVLPLSNQQNHVSLMNYVHLFESQLESMDLALRAYQVGNDVEASYHFNEAIQISDFVAEATLSLIRTELHSSEKVYLSLIGQSINLGKIGMWAFVAVVMLILLFSFWFSAGITRPIGILTRAAKEVSKGNFDEEINIRTSDEISFLAETFDQMRGNIKNLIHEIKNKAELEKELQEHQLLLRESELKSLQAQINPHFLFNTLNTLSKKAYLEGAEETSNLISIVAGLFRYNLRDLDRLVSLQEELHVIEKYFQILKARFPRRLAYEIEIQADVEQIQMPGMILQPFVENAFIHAVEPLEEGGRIILRVTDQAEWVEVQIEDNGPGIPPEKMKQIKQALATGERTGGTTHGSGIGISNATRRLALFYQREDVMKMSSVEGEGTCITLRLFKGGKTHD